MFGGMVGSAVLLLYWRDNKVKRVASNKIAKNEPVAVTNSVTTRLVLALLAAFFVFVIVQSIVDNSHESSLFLLIPSITFFFLLFVVLIKTIFTLSRGSLFVIRGAQIDIYLDRKTSFTVRADQLMKYSLAGVKPSASFSIIGVKVPDELIAKTKIENYRDKFVIDHDEVTTTNPYINIVNKMLFPYLPAEWMLLEGGTAVLGIRFLNLSATAVAEYLELSTQKAHLVKPHETI